VIRQGRRFSGVEAVIDKDLASAKLAEEINVDIFIIATDVDGAAINYGKTDQRMLRKISLSKIERYIQKGHFPAGSMGPKVKAVTQFFKNTGNRGIICHLKDIEKAIKGEAGTDIIK